MVSSFKVFYELTHTACDREIIRSGFEFDIYHPSGAWDVRGRPMPPNGRMIKKPEGPYRVGIVGTDDGLNQISKINKKIPLIWKCLTDYSQWERPDAILEKVVAWVAVCKETVARWNMTGHPKTVIIEHGIDPCIFHSWNGKNGKVLTVGNILPRRWEKGPDVLLNVIKSVPVYVAGSQNDPLPNQIGYANSVEALGEIYRSYAVYFNPSTVIVCAVLEAMMTGMPVVTMTPGNFTDLMQHGKNCLIASTVAEARFYIKELLTNHKKATELGKNARESVYERFHPDRCASDWRKLIERVVL